MSASSSPEACLSADAVAGYASGDLTERELEAVEEHIDRCPTCRQIVSGAAEAGLSEGTPGPSDSYAHAPTLRAAPGTLVELAEGTRVGRYVVGPRLGAGGMGVVYSAEDPALGRRVAIKVLRAGVFAQDGPAQEMLRREAMAMARLAHPNVVGVFDLFAIDGATFVVMELVPGTTLRGWLREAPRTPREIVEAFVLAGRGLVAAHEQGIVHRDFKPENVLCDGGGRVCVSDFGLARTMEAPELRGDPMGGDRLTGVAGTPGYMAPEQRTGRRATAKSDQFSFCVGLYEALFAALPAAAQAEDGRTRPPPRELARKGVTPRVRRVLARGLELDPGRRYPSMRDLLDDLTHDQAARRRWLGLVAGALACAVAVGLVGRREASRSASQVCKGGEARLGGVWDADRRGAVEQAFTASGAPFAASAWRSVSAAVDAYSSAWVTARMEACEATRVSREQSEAMMDLRMACLDDRLRNLAALSDVFARADRQVVTRAARAASELAPVAACSDTRALAARVKPPDPAVAARVASASDRLAAAAALEAAGKYADALPIGGAALEEATATGYAPVRASALFLVGRVEYFTSDLKGAARHLHEAELAADTAGDDATRGRVLAWRARIVAAEGAFADVPALSDAALAVVGRIGKDDAVEADVLRLLAIADDALGKQVDARAKFERVVDLETEIFGERSGQVGTALADVANTYQGWEPRSLELDLRALDLEESQLGAEHPAIADAELGIGNAFVEQGQPAEGETHLRRSLSLLEAGKDVEHPELPWALINLAEALVDQGKPDVALPFSQRALAIHEHKLRANHPRLFEPLWSVASCYVRGEQPALAVPLLERALTLPRQDTDELQVAEADLLLAEALDAVHPGSARAVALMSDAEGMYAKGAAGTRDKGKLAEARAWLAQHARGARPGR